MNTWNECISYKRFGFQSNNLSDSRSEFTRDYDKIIFLSAFRRLQNKTQVFPLPGNVFVHNRLTHSLEVASVGRSLGTIVGNAIADKHILNERDAMFYRFELSGAVASACLAHDLGNPAFGHSGEKAISHYFTSHHDQIFNGSSLRSHFSPNEWSDLTNFEGNANALRLLTRQFHGRLEGGHRLMYVTLASIIKYPCASFEIDKDVTHLKKYGHFQSDKSAFENIMDEFGMVNSDKTYQRHPFVYLVEAADDICYRIVDMEDAHRIGIISTELITSCLLEVLKDLGDDTLRTTATVQKISDTNEAISYLRAKTINALVQNCSKIFMDHETEILQGTYNCTLVDEVAKTCPSLDNINKISIDKIYNHHTVIEVEMAGYNVMSELLDIFVGATITDQKTSMQKKVLKLIPAQYDMKDSDSSSYEKVMGILDFVSGMTDGFATDLYRKIKGIDLPLHR